MSFILAPLAAMFGGGGAAAAGGAAAGGFSGFQALSMGLGLLGTVAQAAGASQQAKAEEEAAKFNAAAAEQQARAERDASQAEASDFRRRQMRVLSERRATGGASGLTVAGSPLLVEEATMREIALGGARMGHGGFVRGSRLEDDASLSRMRGQHARRAGSIGVGTTLLTGFAQAGRQAASYWG